MDLAQRVEELEMMLRIPPLWAICSFTVSTVSNKIGYIRPGYPCREQNPLMVKEQLHGKDLNYDVSDARCTTERWKKAESAVYYPEVPMVVFQDQGKQFYCLTQRYGTVWQPI